MTKKPSKEYLEQNWWKFLPIDKLAVVKKPILWLTGSGPLCIVTACDGKSRERKLYTVKDVARAFDVMGVTRAPKSLNPWKLSKRIFTPIHVPGDSRIYTNPQEAYMEGAKTYVYEQFGYKRMLQDSKTAVPKVEKAKNEIKPVASRKTPHAPAIGSLNEAPSLIVWTFQDVADTMQMSIEMIQALVQKGEFVAPRKIGGEYRWLSSEVYEYLQGAKTQLVKKPWTKTKKPKKSQSLQETFNFMAKAEGLV